MIIIYLFIYLLSENALRRREENQDVRWFRSFQYQDGIGNALLNDFYVSNILRWFRLHFDDFEMILRAEPLIKRA